MSYTQSEVQAIIDEFSKVSAESRGKLENRIDGCDKTIEELHAQIDSLEVILGRRGLGGGGWSAGAESAKEHKAAFNSWARQGGNDVELRRLEVAAGLSTVNDPDGGFLVPDEMAKEIDRLATESVAMRRLAKVVKVQGEYKRPLSKGGATGGWVSELADRPETASPELDLFQPMMAEIYAMPSVSQKLLDMSDFDVEGWLMDEIHDVFVEKEGAAFISGDGVGKPSGILDADKMVANASWTYGKTGFIAGGHATLLNSVDALIDLQHALKPTYRKNGVWLMNDATFSVIRKMKDGDGRFLTAPGLAEGAPDRLLGKPIEIDDNMPDIGANAYPVAFCDFQKAYTIADHRNGIRLIRDPYTAKGSVRFYCTKRLAGGISNYEAVKFLKIAA